MPGQDGAHAIDPNQAIDIFYNTSPPDAAARAVARLCPEPDRPLTDPVRLSEARWGGLRKTYVVCTRDQAIPPARQRFLAGRRAENEVRELESDHSPFYTCPALLADLLARVCRDAGGSA